MDVFIRVVEGTWMAKAYRFQWGSYLLCVVCENVEVVQAAW